MTKREKARQLFLSGCNCAQAVFVAFCDEFNLDETSAKQLSAPLGGGVARMRLTCGAVTAMGMVMGLKLGISDLSCDEDKARLYAEVQAVVRDFKEKFGSTCCNDLLGGDADDSPIPTPRTKEFYDTRPCLEIIDYCVDLLEKRFDF